MTEALQVYGEPLSFPEVARIQAVTSRQLRRALLMEWGIFEEDVSVLISFIADPLQRDLSDIDWRCSTSYERDHPLLAQIGAALGKSPAQIDAAWARAILL